MPDTPQKQERSVIPSKRRRAVSTAELFVALEGLLPSAEIEIEWLAEFVATFPDAEDHAEDVVRVRQGTAAIELARRLIARKTYPIRRKQKALQARERHGDV